MQELSEMIAKIRQEIKSGVEQLGDSRAVYEFKKTFLDSKAGKISQLMKEMKNIPAEGRADFGKAVNELKVWANSCFDEIDTRMKEKEAKRARRRAA